MPTYHYLCAKCGHEFEAFQSIKAKPLKTCPKEHCPKPRWGKGAVRRQLSAGAGILFKGSGFYITDYRSEGYKQAARKESETTAPKKETATASKPEAKAASPAKNPKS
ncbi:MAG TPA: zinc ribbon domain-containing protein [Verrucomicrobiota bacterium]|nr:zinc ribbon domain-containing protein [Verrucomicrobiota bacterium]HNU51217.1 zinc ribbon domain-containing protein [Verrucomicrobiota bacterium]